MTWNKWLKIYIHKMWCFLCWTHLFQINEQRRHTCTKINTNFFKFVQKPFAYITHKYIKYYVYVNYTNIYRHTPIGIIFCFKIIISEVLKFRVSIWCSKSTNWSSPPIKMYYKISPGLTIHAVWSIETNIINCSCT